MSERIYLKISYDEKEKAKKCGALFDWTVKQWYVYNEELFLLQFTGQTKLKRSYFQIQDRITHLLSLINHNKNEDVTIPDVDYQQRMSKEIDEYSTKGEEILKQIKDDHNLAYYIELEKRKESEKKPKHAKHKPKPEIALSVFNL